MGAGFHRGFGGTGEGKQQNRSVRKPRDVMIHQSQMCCASHVLISLCK